jgi:hypothetical protein
MKPKQSDTFRENARNCANQAETAKDEPTYKRFKRMEAAWIALAEEQDWLDGETSPISHSNGQKSPGVEAAGYNSPKR